MSHTHSHDHSHNNSAERYTIRFAIGAALNIAFVLIELWYGFASNSLALVSDATHNATDVLGLFIAWVGIWFATTKPTFTRTYGFGRGSILASLANSLIIFVAAGGIFVEAIHRISAPEGVAGDTVMVVALVGIVINAGTAFLFMSNRNKDINLRGAFVHMGADALVSLGVVIGGIAIMHTGWMWIDPVLSIVIAAVIIITAWSLLRDSLNLALDAIPSHIDRTVVEQRLRQIPGVLSIHDLHIWPISTSEIGLTVHLIESAQTPIVDNEVQRTMGALSDTFHINHPTIQIERDGIERVCKLEPEHVI